MLKNIYTTKMSANKKELLNRFSKIHSSSGRVSKIMSFVVERDNIQVVYSGLMQEMSVEKDDRVIRRQNIGKVGKTGTSTGAHLHFEVLINGEYYNPKLIG